MDAFYASVELLRYPELRGLPVVVGGRRAHQPTGASDGSRCFARLREYVGRGVVTTSTYEARALGVHSGMGLMKAAALAPDAILLPADFDEYRKYSRLFKAAVAAIAPEIEDRGIDEIYIDLTGVPGALDAIDADPHAGVRALGNRLKAAVRQATGLSCSLGITPNKLLSKLCSDLEKPNGLTILTMGDIPARIWPLPVRRINGIGPKASARLQELGIRTIGDLAQADTTLLVRRFGAHYGAWLHDSALGRDERPVVTYCEPKSLSRETTFERDMHPRRDREALGQIFTDLCIRLSEDLRKQHYLGKTIAVKLRYDDFRIVTRAVTLPAYTDDPGEIRRTAGQCLKRVALDRRLRLLGVRAGSLCRADALPELIKGNESSLAADTGTLPLFD
ncbi:MAG: DNA polymerase IV [Rhodocyclales bacterium]|nr:DNA polymerase IV [Rhodocyclales bacterium]